MPAARRYDAYLVDLDGTLYRAKPLKWFMAAELALCGLHRVRVVRAFRREHERLREQGQSALSPYAVQLANTARELKLPLEHVESIVLEWMQTRPSKWIRRWARTELLEELRQFQRAGGLLGLVSDYPASLKLAAFENAPTFDVIVANGEEGGPERLKPDPNGYQMAAQKLGVAAERCLVIGDREDADGQAARRAGMDFRLVK